MRKKIIAGNWKMNKTTAEAIAFAEKFLGTFEKKDDRKVAICAPFTQLSALKHTLAGSGVRLGAQNMHFEEAGAFTGEISAEMLTEIGIDYCIIGHSERREYFNETDETVNKKLKRAFEHDIIPILCVGENLAQRDAGEAESVIKKQLEMDLAGLNLQQAGKLIVAYEPIWAIGTGRTATPQQASEMCGFIRRTVGNLYDGDVEKSLRVQYGGSVKPDNAPEILNMPDVDGALVGGASLKPEDFQKIIDF